jgi:hypothetical protein
MTKPWLIKKDTEDKFVTVMGAKVYLKPLKYGKAREALNVALKLDTMTGKASMDTGLLATLRALYQIKDWELTDDNDEKLPVNLKTLDEELSEEFVEALIQEINKHGKADSEVSEDEKKQ